MAIDSETFNAAIACITLPLEITGAVWLIHRGRTHRHGMFWTAKRGTWTLLAFISVCPRMREKMWTMCFPQAVRRDEVQLPLSETLVRATSPS